MMKYLATLIANPSKADLDYRDVEEVKETLEQEGYTSSNPFWMASLSAKLMMFCLHSIAE